MRKGEGGRRKGLRANVQSYLQNGKVVTLWSGGSDDSKALCCVLHEGLEVGNKLILKDARQTGDSGDDLALALVTPAPTEKPAATAARYK